MCKVSCILLLLITVGNCSTRDTIVTTVTEGSRSLRNLENPNDNSAAKSADYVEESPPYEDDYARQETSKSEGGRLLGNWRNNGAAFEPKWRDGDSVPLVPFNAAKHAKPGRHEILREDPTFREWDSSHAVTKASSPRGDTGENSGEESVEGTSGDKPVEARYTPATNLETKDRRTVENDYKDVSRYRNEYESGIFPRLRKQRPSAVLTDELRYETTEDAGTSGRSVKRTEKHELTPVKDDDEVSRSRYRETFKVHPNEYELNDEEYQKPRPRKRRPPQHYEFSEMRAPTYSITWSTEKYVERVASSTRSSAKRPEVPTRRRPDSKNSSIRRDRNKSAPMDSQRASENAELKSLLKMQQVEGLSLSEILQRRNLTLNDLLKGKADVINVLKSTDSNEDSTGFSSIKPKIFEPQKVFTTTERSGWGSSRPPGLNIFDSKRNEVASLAMSDDGLSPRNGSSNEPDEDSLEKLDSAETEDVQRKSHDNDEKLSVVVKLNGPIVLPRLNSFADSVTTVATTAKALSSVEDDEIMEFSDFTMNKHFPSTTIYPMETTRKNGLDTTKFDDNYEEDSGSTLSIEHILSVTEETPTFLPATTEEPNGFDNKFNNVVAESARGNDTYVFESFDYQSDEPREAMEEIDPVEEELPLGDQPYEETTENPEPRDESSDDETLLSNHQIFSTSSKPYEVEISEIEPEARAEIFELFSSGSSAKRLERLLMSRNMSIGELIALRQRGSSKIHLAEVMRSRETLGSRSQKHNDDNQASGNAKRNDEVVTTEEIFLDKTPTKSSEDLSDIEIDATSAEATARGTTEQHRSATEEHTNIYSIGTERGESASTTESSDRKNVRLLDLLTAFDSLPFSVRPEFDSTARPRNIEKTTTSGDPEDRRALEDRVVKTDSSSEDTASFVEVGFVEEILSDDSTMAGDLEDTNVFTNHSSGTIGEDRKISSKVRPSIIASGAILGVTIVVFLAIFIVCRIRQKQKYTYRNTFSRAVFQGPVMTARKLSNSSSLNTIMVNVVATSTAKRPERRETQEIEDDFEFKSDIENDSLDANDSWETIPDFMK